MNGKKVPSANESLFELTTKCKARISLVLLTVALYVVLFMLLYNIFRGGVLALSVLPVALIGLICGRRGGVAASVLAFPVNTVLLNLVGYQSGGWDVILRAGGLPGTFIIVIIGYAFGYLRDLYAHAKSELRERELATAALQRSEQKYRELFNTAERQAQEMALLDEVRTALARELDLANIFRTVVEGIAHTFGYTQVSLYLLQEQTLRLQNQVGYAQVIAEIPITQGISGRVARTGVSVYIPDVRQAPEFIGAMEGTVSEICVPLFEERKVVGILNVESTHGITLTEHDFRLMTALSEQINIAIGRARVHAALRESEEYYRTLIENTFDAISLVDVDGTILWTSPSTQRVLGYTPEEFVGHNAAEFVHPEDLKTTGGIADSFQQPDSVARLQIRVRHKDGEWRWMDSVTRNLLNEPNVPALVANYRDITESKQAEAELGTSQARLARILETAEDGIISTDANQCIRLFNQGAEKIFGYAAAEVIGQPLALLLPARFAASHPQFIAEFAASSINSRRMRAPREVFGRRKNDSEFPAEASISKLDLLGEQTFTVIVRDITERKQAEEALRASEERFLKAFHLNPSSVAVTRLSDGQHIEVNAAFLRDSGYSREEVIGHTSAELNLWVDSDVRARYRLLRETQGHVENFEWRYRTKGGEIRHALLFAEPLELRGEPCVLATAIDITDRKRAEEILKRQNKYLATLHTIALDLLNRREIDDLLQSIVEHAVDLFDAPFVEIMLVEDNYLVTRAFTKNQPFLMGERTGRNDARLSWQAYDTKRPMQVNDYAVWREHRSVYDVLKLRAVLCVPILAGEDCIGVLDLSRDQVGHSFSSEETQIATLFAEMVALAMDNARLYTTTREELQERRRVEEELRVSERHLRLFNEMTQTAIGAKDLSALLQTLADRLSELFDADECFITLWDETNQRTIPAAAFGEWRDTYPRPQSDPGELTMTESVLRAGHALVADDTFNSPYLSPRNAAQYPQGSLLGLPLIVGEEKLGAALISFPLGHRFSAEEIAHGEQVAGQIVSAIAKALLLEETRRRAEQLAALHALTNDLAAHYDLQALLETLIERAMSLLHVKSGAITLYDSAQGVLEAAARQNFPALSRQRPVMGRGLTGRVAQTRLTLIVNDYQTWEGQLPEYTNLRRVIGAPMLFSGELVGVLAVAEFGTLTGAFTADDARLLELLAAHAASAVHMARLYAQVQQLARIDDLTGVSNRRHLFELGEFEYSRARRLLHPLTAIMFDLDRFKEVNDTYGHMLGDQALRAVADNCRRVIRGIDIIGRYGGDEFAVLLPETSLAEAQIVAERIRQLMAKTPIDTTRGPLNMALSLGVAEIDEAIPNIGTLLDRADFALYQAKQSGGNRVALFGK